MAKREPSSTIPYGAIVAGVVSLVAIVAALVVALSLGKGLDSRATPLVVTILTTVSLAIPTMLGALKADRADRAIRNGVVMDKARQGAAQAIDEKQVVTRVGPVVVSEMQALNVHTLALTELLRQAQGIQGQHAKTPAPLGEGDAGA